MSKNKNYHNYTNYNKPKHENEKVEVVSTPEVPLEEPVSTPEIPAEEPVITPTQEIPILTIGIVSNCLRLRVRAAASTNSEVLCEIEVDSEVTIDISKSTKDFYAVCTSAGVEGFCMKKFIEVK